MPENTKVKLRSLDTLQIVDRSIRLFRRHLFKFSAIVLLLLLPLMVLELGVPRLIINQSLGNLVLEYPYSVPFSSSLLQLHDAFAMVKVIAEWLFSLLAVVVLARAVADIYLGQFRGVFKTFQGALKLWVRLLLSIALVLLLQLVFLVVLRWLALTVEIGWFSVGVLGGIPIFFVLELPFLIPVVVFEKQSLLGVLWRVWDLLRLRFMDTIGALLFVLVLVGISKYLFSIIFQYLTYVALILPALCGLSSLLISEIILSLIALLGRLFYIPLQVTVLVLFYLDLRVRGEGLDLALNAERSLEDVVDPLSVLAQAPKPRSGPLFVGREWWYLGVCSLVSIAISFLIRLFYLYLSRLGLFSS